ncbi:RagB/SusD family nutrient uptake outer membrane protein [Mucilaginibacter paludis]|uniref:RagB/SusD domain-containing protein n=1 Tax=Mucilaginibacter paludis DSM 18603 TaxID=714943 RepID=H1YIX8_9SPHI|nr:RagB/SusD family nutrient uptake outer membrane protein [Mucilaginibacter paludis]EHQ27673.1 RagB/SusD domain-containing protein [Mucilaginibacter paludis DSM 18603]
MKKIQYIILILAVITVSFTACKKNELDKQPLDASSAANFWKTETNAVQAVNNIYRYLGDFTDRIFLSCATDDSYSWSNWPDDIQYAGNGTGTASNGVFSHYWSNFYTMIGAANNVLDNINKVTGMTDDKRKRLIGESRFLRAYAYQQLIGMYGDVPLITHVQAISEFDVARTSKATVSKFIVAELDTIATYLPLTYATADQGRITRGAAMALKARTLLYNAQYTEAATAAKAVMDLSQYSIDGDYLSLFNGSNKTSPEIILAGQYLANTYTNATATWVGGPTLGGWSQVVPLQKLVDDYECTDGNTIDQSALYNPAKPFDNRDPRLKLTVVVPGTTVNGNVIDVTSPNSIDALGKNNASFTGYYYKKYIPTVISGNWDSNSYNDIVLIRYAEVLLTYAEAKIEAGSIDQSVYDAINKVRQRPGVNMPALTAATASTQVQLRAAVRRERHVEFPMEDNRLFDIRRWKIAETVMPGNAYGILNYFNTARADYGQHVLVEKRQFNVSRDYLWPIPQNEIDLNKQLVQNPGW